jgi:hypothetical protein
MLRYKYTPIVPERKGPTLEAVPEFLSSLNFGHWKTLKML